MNETYETKETRSIEPTYKLLYTLFAIACIIYYFLPFSFACNYFSVDRPSFMENGWISYWHLCLNSQGGYGMTVIMTLVSTCALLVGIIFYRVKNNSRVAMLCNTVFCGWILFVFYNSFDTWTIYGFGADCEITTYGPTYLALIEFVLIAISYLSCYIGGKKATPSDVAMQGNDKNEQSSYSTELNQSSNLKDKETPALYCTECGNRIGNAKFCPYCGHKQDILQ